MSFYIFQTFQVSQVALSECHEETDSLDTRDVECQRLDLFMVQKVHILLSYFREIILSFDFYRLGFYPVSILPVGAFCGHFPDIDLRVKVGCERGIHDLRRLQSRISM